jgi:plastocyanin
MRSPRWLLILVVALFGLVAACGDDDDDDGGGGGGGSDTLVIEGLEFPDSFTAAPGATVPIENRDNANHTVTSEDGGFDVAVDPNGSAELTAPDDPRDYEVICNIHGGMQMTLTVEE